jgi:hypothetical protein
MNARAAGSVTSPRLRGEVGSRSDPGEGNPRYAQDSKFAPHPNPLPAFASASGEREPAVPAESQRPAQAA